MGLPDNFNQAKTAFEQLGRINVNEIASAGKNLQPWNGLGPEDLLASHQFIHENLSDLFARDLEQIPPAINSFQTWNNLKAHLTAVLQKLTEFNTNKDQPRFNKVLQQMEGLRHQLQALGIYQALHASPDVDQIIQQISGELTRLTDGNSRLDQLETNLKELTGKAVSGSLSRAFQDLKAEMDKEKTFWFRMAIGTAIATVLVLGLVIIGSEYLISRETSSLKDVGNGTIWILRVAIATPAFYFLWFAMAQYRRERSLTQEYAHRAAVATSLPSYKDQLKDEKAKDNISVAASHVIFDVPSISDRDVKIDKTIKQLSELAGTLNKAKG